MSATPSTPAPLAGPVLAATSLDTADDEVLRQARALATGLHTTLAVCHVLPEAVRVRPLFPQHAGVDAEVMARLDEQAREAVAHRIAEATGSPHDGTIEIAAGTPHAGVLEVAARTAAGLIVMGPGDTALHVARAAARPVLIARPAAPGGDVIGATDFSDPALPALRAAAAEARRRGVGLRLLHSLDLDSATTLAASSLGGMMPLLPEGTAQALEDESRQRLAQAMADTGMSGEVIVVRSRPGPGILAAAGEAAAGLIVVGTRGRSGLARLMLGSVAEDVVRRAPCPVLVVPLGPE